MEKIEEFYAIVKKADTAVLATEADSRITMRIISPVYYENRILFFTSKNTTKFHQLEKNNNCCLAIDNFFVEATAEFLGSTMTEENTELRDVYSQKYVDAFNENEEYGGRDSDFILLKPTRITGWGQEVSFDIEVE